VIIKHSNLSDRSWVLELEGSLLLDSENDTRGRLDTDLKGFVKEETEVS
jgi:hypothetical protein